MSPEPSKLDSKKQKIMIGALVVIVLIILWMFMGPSGGGETIEPVTPAPNVASKPPGTPGMAPAAPPARPSAASSQPKPAVLPANSELLKMQQQTQQEYIASLNKLQMLKLQREIDETKTAIATAELNRMTAEKSIADLITAKPQIAPETPEESAMNAQTQNAQAQNAQPAQSEPVRQIQVAPPPVVDYPYQVLSVAYQGRKWSAVIGGQGKLYNVVVGDTLMPDNSRVVAINRKGVTLKRNTTTRVINITTSM